MGVGGKTARRESSKRASAKMQQYNDDDDFFEERLNQSQMYVVPKIAVAQKPIYNTEVPQPQHHLLDAPMDFNEVADDTTPSLTPSVTYVLSL